MIQERPFPVGDTLIVERTAILPMLVPVPVKSFTEPVQINRFYDLHSFTWSDSHGVVMLSGSFVPADPYNAPCCGETFSIKAPGIRKQWKAIVYVVEPDGTRRWESNGRVEDIPED